MTPADCCDLIRRRSRPLAPAPTGVAERRRRLDGVRAVLFDVYGTLVISGSGEVGSVDAGSEERACGEALEAAGFVLRRPEAARAAAEAVRAQIAADHARARERGVGHPEVEIRQVWRRAMERVANQGLAAPPSRPDWERLALEYELRVNPVWPMPGAAACLEELTRRGRLWGVVSNAQFYTPLLFPALFGGELDELGADPGLQYYSYRYGQAKPGGLLFELARRNLADRGVAADQIIYVGNDMLNDIAAAAEAGFRTALFAGDARSLRWRRDHPRAAGASPDLVITSLTSLLDCLP